MPQDPTFEGTVTTKTAAPTGRNGEVRVGGVHGRRRRVRSADLQAHGARGLPSTETNNPSCTSVSGTHVRAGGLVDTHRLADTPESDPKLGVMIVMDPPLVPNNTSAS